MIVLIASATTFVIAGAFVSYGQFIAPLSSAFGWSVGLIGLGSTLRQVASMASTLTVGPLTDPIRPRPVMLGGPRVPVPASLLPSFSPSPSALLPLTPLV